MTDPLAAARKIRRLGVLLLIAGLSLIGFIGTIAVKMYPSMSHPGVADMSGTTFTGTAEQAHQALLLFALVVAFGLVSTLNGIWQIATGRRSLAFVVVTFAVAAGLAFAGRSIMAW